MNWLSDSASWVTLLAFLILLVSKFLLVRQAMGNIINDFSLNYLENFDAEQTYDELVVDDENENNGPMGLISSMNLKSVEFIRINDESGNPLEKPETVALYQNLPRNCLLQVHVRIPEGYPLYEIKIKREDYVWLRREVTYNGFEYRKALTASGKATWKTYLYYLFK